MVIFGRNLERMGFIAKYFEKERSSGERLKKIRDESEKLREILVPYKIQVNETPYFAREEVINSSVRLREIEEEEKGLRDSGILREGIFKSFYRYYIKIISGIGKI